VNIAAIAAAVFTLLDSTSKTAGKGTASNQEGTTTPTPSTWKRAARTEALM